MRRASHFHRWPGRHTGLWRLALLGLCFCGGILLGQLAARSVPEASRTELAAYLRQYAAVWGETTDRTASLLRVAGVYLRYPLLVTVLGFGGAAGAALILPVLAAEGFFLAGRGEEPLEEAGRLRGAAASGYGAGADAGTEAGAVGTGNIIMRGVEDLGGSYCGIRQLSGAGEARLRQHRQLLFAGSESVPQLAAGKRGS